MAALALLVGMRLQLRGTLRATAVPDPLIFRLMSAINVSLLSDFRWVVFTNGRVTGDGPARTHGPLIQAQIP